MARPLFRLFSPQSPAPRVVERERIEFALADGHPVTVLRVRDPRAKRLRLSVDERGARLTLPPRTSLVAGERFLHEHRDWLALQLRQQQFGALPTLQPGVELLVVEAVLHHVVVLL